MKRLSILGSTGSIGTSALNIVRMHPDRFQVKALTAANNIDFFSKQIDEFKPELVAVFDEKKALELSRALKGSNRPEILFGETGFNEAASYGDCDMVLLAMVGAAGLKPALCAIEAKKQIALANKETLVMAGEIIMAKALENGVSILPVDSEH
ncbi:MAG: 1-deoxy-D-xylulose-5-phosphate reductoisomerase, partial [Desulfobacula sp.]|nr:1-deoxy-D-xylulose-5-phosphate reductoisomerase [Desulfobacula sp.]